MARYFKSSGPARVVIDGFGPGSVCLSEVQVGDHLIFYATGNPDDVLHAFYLSQFDAVEKVTDEVVVDHDCIWTSAN